MATHQKKHIKSSEYETLLRKKEGLSEFYAIVKQPLGNCSFRCTLLNNEEFTAKVCGKMKQQKIKSNILKANDFILVEKDSLTSAKPNYTIILKYSESYKKELQKMGENITSQPRVNETRNAGTEIHLESEHINVEETTDDVNIDDI